MGIRSLIILLEELGASSASLSLSIGLQNIANYLLSGTPYLKSEFLDGKAIIGVHIPERIFSKDRIYAINGEVASYFLIIDEDGVKFYSRDAVNINPENMLGLKASSIVSVQINGEPDGVIPDKDFVNLIKVVIGGVSLGVIKRVLKESLEYAKQRVQFGKNIISFGMVQEMLGRMKVQEMFLRTLLYNLDFPISDLEASSINGFAGDSVMYVADKGVQIYGGYGYTRDYPMERFFRDAKALQTLLGNGMSEFINIGKIMGEK